MQLTRSAYLKMHCSDYHVFTLKSVRSRETFTVEGYNSLFRHFLARLRRRTKCYTKALYMLIYSVKLLMLKWNNALAILI